MLSLTGQLATAPVRAVASSKWLRAGSRQPRWVFGRDGPRSCRGLRLASSLSYSMQEHTHVYRDAEQHILGGGAAGPPSPRASAARPTTSLLQDVYSQVVRAAGRAFPDLAPDLFLHPKHTVAVSKPFSVSADSGDLASASSVAESKKKKRRRHQLAHSVTATAILDVQSNLAFQLARHLSRPPADVARALVAELTLNPVISRAEASPQGFVNIALSPALLFTRLREQSPIGSTAVVAPAFPRDGDLAADGAPRKICIDSGGPNVGKQLHVGHLRSAIIGQALCNVYNFLGDQAECVSHVGDFGTPIGLVINEAILAQRSSQPFQRRQTAVGHSPVRIIRPPGRGGTANRTPIRQEPLDAGALLDSLSTIEQLDALYVRAVARSKADPTVAGKAHAIVRSIQQRQVARAAPVDEEGGAGDDADPDADVFVLAWEAIRRLSRASYGPLFERLGVWTGMNERPESSYAPLIPQVLSSLGSDAPAGVFKSGTSSKARVAFAVNDTPLMLRTSKGTYLYGMTDLAAIYHRTRLARYDLLVYVTDSAQQLHFQQVFELANLMGWCQDGQLAVHAPFGVVKGENGRKLSSRDGKVPRLSELMDMAVDRAKAVRTGLLPDASGPALDSTAGESVLTAVEGPETTRLGTDSNVDEVIGVSALKFFDLSHERSSAYEFSLDRMVELRGKSAVYCLYTHARACSILRGAGTETGDASSALLDGAPAHPLTVEERQLLLALTLFYDSLHHVERELSLHPLCEYVYEVCRAFNLFYARCPVLSEDADQSVRLRRLFLCGSTRAVIASSLHLLGIPSLEKL